MVITRVSSIIITDDRWDDGYSAARLLTFLFALLFNPQKDIFFPVTSTSKDLRSPVISMNIVYTMCDETW